LAAALLTLSYAAAQEDIADISSQELLAGKDEHKRYFLIAPEKVASPETEQGLLIVLPGGDGSAEFHPFVKRIYKNAVPPGYVLAQPIAVQWTDKQPIVWPTEKNPVTGMKFSTEDFVAAVIEDVRKQQKVDPKRIFTLTWSSSGPAAYTTSLAGKGVTGSFVAMSVFKPDFLPPLEGAKGHRFFLYHSPDDRVCPFRMAQQAAKDLEKHGAVVKLVTYEGGHGWRGDVFGQIREGLQWLENDGQATSRSR
jgi:predicted esterase